MATGRRAVESVNRFLSAKSLLDGRNIEYTSSYSSKLFKEDWTNTKKVREDMASLVLEKRAKSFEEFDLAYTKEEAERESNRCRQCECKMCTCECIMLNDYTDCPKTLFKGYLEKGYKNMDKMITYSCNEYNQCRIKCPREFDIKENFMNIKEQYRIDNNGKNVVEGLKRFVNS